MTTWLTILAETNYAKELEKLLVLPPGTDLFSIINTGLFYAMIFSGLIVTAFLIYGGYQYITSAGNPEAGKKATSTITWAIAGLVVILAAGLIVQWLLQLLMSGKI